MKILAFDLGKFEGRATRCSRNLLFQPSVLDISGQVNAATPIGFVDAFLGVLMER
jgi:hypothetical protein